MTSRQIALYGPGFNLRQALFAAQACASAYAAGNDPVNVIGTMAQQMGSGTPIWFNPGGLNSQAVIFPFTPAGALVAFAGITSFRQFVAYMLSAGLGPSPVATLPNDTGPPTQSAYLTARYNEGALISSIKRALQDISYGATLNSVPVVICGHSQGAGLATLLAADLRQNNTTLRINNVYLFGSPRVYGLASKNTFNSWNLPVWNIRNQADPIPYFPDDSVAMQRLSNLGTGGLFGTRLTYLPDYDYGILNTPYQLTPTWCRRTAPFSSNSGAASEIIQQALTQGANGNIIPDHTIGAYVANLSGIALRSTPASNPQREAVAAVAAVPTPAPTVNEDLPEGVLPMLIAVPPSITPPAGAGFQPPRGRVLVTSFPDFGNSGPPSRQRGPRAAIGDGHAKLATRQLLGLMEFLDAHDSAVADGSKRGTQYIHGVGRIDQATETAWYEVEAYIRERVEEGQ